MAKNFMHEIAKMLGVEIGEEFTIENADRKETVVLAMDGLHVIQPNNVLGPDHGKLLSNVLQGFYEVKKKPWEPKINEQFYRPNIISKTVVNELWTRSTLNSSLKLLGMVYRTMEEAKANFAKDYQKLTGKKLEV